MPFTSGQTKTPSTLLKAINDLGVANGWIKLRGEEDMDVLNPVAAKYWRLAGWATVTTSNTSVRWSDIAFNETIGGARITGGNWTASHEIVGAMPGPARINIDRYTPFWIQYEHPTPITVREFTFAPNGTFYAPSGFSIEWSNDGIVWTPILAREGFTAWDGNNGVDFTWADGTYWNGHAGPAAPRRAGSHTFFEQGYQEEPGDLDYPDRFASEDYWVWQLPAYDADTRIYLHAMGSSRLDASTDLIRFAVTPSYDPSKTRWGDQFGWNDLKDHVCHVMDSNEKTFWAYINGHRLILATKSGTDDYGVSYVGNMAAFAPPAEYPFPLAMFSITDDDYIPFSEQDNRWNAGFDPGDDCGFIRTTTNEWLECTNRTTSESSRQRYKTNTPCWVWPYHVGSATQQSWPYSMVGSWRYGRGHWLNGMVPTANGDLALFPVTVQQWQYGNIGHLDGMFAVGGNSLLPEQTFTIGGVNYRVFCARNLRQGNNFVAVRED